MNVALDLLFIVVLHTGVEGAAIATVISQAVSVLLCVNYLRRSEALVITRADWKLNGPCCRVLLAWDFPPACNAR